MGGTEISLGGKIDYMSRLWAVSEIGGSAVLREKGLRL